MNVTDTKMPVCAVSLCPDTCHAPVNNRIRGIPRVRSAIIGMAFAVIAAAPASSTVLFRPVGRPPEVFTYNGTTMTQPLTSNPNALKSPTVYFIFVGPNWEQYGQPTPAVNSMVYAARAILGSSYLSGLRQYGSDGLAGFGGFTIDTTLDPLTWSNTNPDGSPNNNPVWFETDRILSNPAFASWLPTAGDARTSPIYVVVRYSQDGTGAGFGGGGSNNFGPNQYTSRAINAIDVSIPTADQVDAFTFILSHELAERISAGTGGLTEVSPDPGGQIADGEPEGNQAYAWRLYGGVGPVVTAYWSVLDQAFIIPDGTLDRVLLVPIWSTTTWARSFLSLQQGNLYLMANFSQKVLIDTQVRSFVVNQVNQSPRIFYLTSSGQVREYSTTSGTWTAVTGAATYASSLASTSYLAPVGPQYYSIQNGGLYMIANNGWANQVWQYSGSGTDWTPISPSSTSLTSLAVRGCGTNWSASCGSLFRYDGVTVYQYSGSGANWSPVTGTNTIVSALTAAGGNIYMLAHNRNSQSSVWQYSGSGTNWTPLTGANTDVESIAVAGDVLYMSAANTGLYAQVWQYSLAPYAWQPLTGTNTVVEQILVQDGSELYMEDTSRVWQYRAPYDWQPLTGSNTSILSVSVTSANQLTMYASNNGGPDLHWVYSGTPYAWTQE